jgi:hypothetical protein
LSGHTLDRIINDRYGENLTIHIPCGKTKILSSSFSLVKLTRTDVIFRITLGQFNDLYVLLEREYHYKHNSEQSCRMLKQNI